MKKTQEKENPGKYYQEKEDQKKARQETERKSEKVRAALMPTQAVKGPPQIQVQARFEEVDKVATGPRLDKVHNCLLCEAKEGKKLQSRPGGAAQALLCVSLQERPVQVCGQPRGGEQGPGREGGG